MNAESLDVTWRAMLMFGVVFMLACVAVRLLAHSPERKACQFLSAFMLVFALNQVPQIIGYSGFYQAFPCLTFAPFNNELWLGPLLLWHVTTLTKSTLPRWHRLLFFPAICQSVYYGIVFVIFPDYRDKWAFNDAVHHVFIQPVEVLLTLVVSAYCLIKSIQLIQAYQRDLPNIVSEEEPFDIRWLNQCVWSIAVLYGIWFSSELINQFIFPLSYTAYYPVHVLLAFLVAWLGLNALANIQLAFPVPSAQDSTAVTDDDHISQLRQRIHQLFESERWYLQPRVTLTDLTTRLASNESYVSRAINEGFSLNFNGLVNSYRIAFAKQCLVESPNSGMTDIQYRAGFNSKASFYRCFKQFEGCTPAEYAKRLAA